MHVFWRCSACEEARANLLGDSNTVSMGGIDMAMTVHAPYLGQRLPRLLVQVKSKYADKL